MTVSVLVPYRADNGPRDRAWAYVRARWKHTYPGWQVVEGNCPDGPWVKALAVADALTRADGDILVIADADVVVERVDAAVVAVQQGSPWAIPHRGVYRLTPAATDAVLAGGPLPSLMGRLGPDVVQRSYTGITGGGMVVLPRALYRRVPLDPRFAGWGGEDLSWGTALQVTSGPPWRGAGPLWHLWHPPQPRASAVGSPEAQALHGRYRAAATPSRMWALLAEIT